MKLLAIAALAAALSGMASARPAPADTRSTLLVETDWLAAHAGDAGVRIVDMRTRGYETGHIPGAVLLDNNAIRVASGPPTFLPSASDVEKLMAGLGISDATRVVVYDDRGGIYAARLWFVLNAFGHPNVALLNGGWTRWTAEQRPTSADRPAIATGVFHARLNPRWVATAADVVAAIGKPGIRIVDARTPGEIAGTDLRGIKRGGAIPSSIPVYWEDALDATSKAFKSTIEIEKLYRDRGIGPNDEVITYCQIGMRASHDLFTLALVGHTNARVYYGSWEEWGNRDDLPIKKGSDPARRKAGQTP
jgi:thiosulfate/3-mercaptopyruvate sulfurtransferase